MKIYDIVLILIFVMILDLTGIYVTASENNKSTRESNINYAASITYKYAEDDVRLSQEAEPINTYSSDLLDEDTPSISPDNELETNEEMLFDGVIVGDYSTEEGFLVHFYADQSYTGYINDEIKYVVGYTYYVESEGATIKLTIVDPDGVDVATYQIENLRYGMELIDLSTETKIILYRVGE